MGSGRAAGPEQAGGSEQLRCAYALGRLLELPGLSGWELQLLREQALLQPPLQAVGPPLQAVGPRLQAWVPICRRGSPFAGVSLAFPV